MPDGLLPEFEEYEGQLKDKELENGLMVDSTKTIGREAD